MSVSTVTANRTVNVNGVDLVLTAAQAKALGIADETQRVSDVSGDSGAFKVTIKFGKSAGFAVDLTEAEFNEFVLPVIETLPFIEYVPGAFQGQASESAAIREWAKANGLSVSARGRLSESVVAEWNLTTDANKESFRGIAQANYDAAMA